MMSRRRAAVSAIDLISGRGFTAHKWGNLLTPPFSLFSSNFHSDRAKVPRIDFSRVKELDDAIPLFHQMIRMRPQPSVTAYSKLLSITVKMKHYSFALHMFDEMRRMGAPVNDYTMNIAINCYCLQKRVNFGFSIMGIFFKSGYEPDVTTFGTLIKGIILDDKVADAVKLFKKLVDLRLCEPDDVMIMTVIDGLCKAGQIIEAHDLLCQLERSKWKPMLGVKAYSALVDGLCKCGMVDDAFQLLSRMIDKGISPNVVTYGALINGLCKIGKHDIARDLFNQLPSRGVPPNVQTYTMIIGSLCQEASMEEVKCLLIEMENRGCAPNAVTYNVIVQSLLKKNELHHTIPFLEEMPKRGFSADSATSSMLIDQVLAQNGDDFLLKLMENVLPEDIIRELY